MTKTIQKVKGTAKEIAAEILGDKDLQDEGKRDRRDADSDKEEEPSDAVRPLQDLT